MLDKSCHLVGAGGVERERDRQRQRKKIRQQETKVVRIPGADQGEGVGGVTGRNPTGRGVSERAGRGQDR